MIFTTQTDIGIFDSGACYRAPSGEARCTGLCFRDKVRKSNLVTAGVLGLITETLCRLSRNFSSLPYLQSPERDDDADVDRCCVGVRCPRGAVLGGAEIGYQHCRRQ